jgi:integrase
MKHNEDTTSLPDLQDDQMVSAGRPGKKTRRANHEGCIIQVSSGLWRAAVSLPNGKRKWLSGKTRSIVEEKLRRFQREQAAGLGVQAQKMPVEQPQQLQYAHVAELEVIEQTQSVEQFMNDWLEHSVKRTNRPRVYEHYAMISRLHLVPDIGQIPLAKLTPAQVQRVLNRLHDEGKAIGTIRNVRGVLRHALNYAIRQEMITRNVASLTDLPRVSLNDEDDTERIHFLTIQQALDLLAVVKGHRWELIYRLALELGLRRGELAALRVADIDFEKQQIHVTGTLHRSGGKLHRFPPKTRSSRRTLPLGDHLVEALRNHIAERESYAVERQEYVGDWVESGFLFTSERGTPIEPTNIYRHFKKAAAQAGLPPSFRFHDLRHSCASFLIADGVHVRVVMEVLGHSEIPS